MSSYKFFVKREYHHINRIIENHWKDISVLSKYLFKNEISYLEGNYFIIDISPNIHIHHKKILDHLNRLQSSKNYCSIIANKIHVLNLLG